jgi:hypothetical protein
MVPVRSLQDDAAGCDTIRVLPKLLGALAHLGLGGWRNLHAAEGDL